MNTDFRKQETNLQYLEVEHHDIQESKMFDCTKIVNWIRFCDLRALLTSLITQPVCTPVCTACVAMWLKCFLFVTDII